MKPMVSNAEPDVTLHIPHMQWQAVQTRLTDYLLQSQYAFLQSFSGGLATTFDIFVDTSVASTPESLQLVLCPTTNPTSMAVVPDRSPPTAPQSAHLAALTERLVAMCTADPQTC
jgi:hypothetical protein